MEYNLKKLKENYLKTKPSQTVESSWGDLEILLMENQKNNTYRHFWPIIALLIIFLSGTFLGVFSVAQASLPGEPLYQVKRASEDIISIVSPSSNIKVKNRAKEIVGISKGKKDKERLTETVEEYQKEIERTHKEIPSESEKDDFQKELKEQEDKFREIQHDEEELSEELKKAIKAAKEGREDDANHDREENEED